MKLPALVDAIRIEFCFQTSAERDSVDPADGDPLWQRADVVYALLQRVYRFVDVVIYNFHVKKMSVVFLKHFAFG